MIEGNKQPLISCIIPVFNAEQYLHRCINSVLAQDYRALEIILIDDGSTDTSPKICDEYATQHCNIIVKHIPNGGASLARKVGVELAKGEYLTFVDTDDYVTHNYVSAMFEALQKYDTTIAGCGSQCIKPGNEAKIVNRPTTILLKDDTLMTRFFNYEFWALWGGLYLKSVFTNIDFPKATLSEDYYIKCQMFLCNCKMAYVDTPLYIYEKHEDSLSNTKLSLKAFEEFENVHHVYKLIQAEMSQYTALALKNVTETSVKLLLMGNTVERESYSNQYRLIKSFLKKQMPQIWRNPYLLRNIKIIATILRYFPIMSDILKIS